MSPSRPRELKIKADQIPTPEGLRLQRALCNPQYLRLFHFLLEPVNLGLCRALMNDEYVARFRTLLKDV